MAKDKKPSIYSDRGTIGSSEELDEYGVWVKSEPQDLSSEEVEMPELNAELPGDEDMDFAIPEIEDLPDFDSFDEKSPDDFSSTEIPTDDFAIPDIESETETTAGVDESGGGELDLGDITVETEPDSLDIPDLDESLDSESLDSESSDSESPDSSGLEISLEPADSEEPADLEKPESEGDFDFPEIGGQDQDTITLDADSSGTESSDEFEGISMDDSISDLIENFDIGTEELPDESMELDSGASDEEYVPLAEPVQTEIQPETDSPKESGLAAPSSSPDLSTQLLMKIAEELSSIRAELSSLKKEFSGIRAVAPSVETEESGFFDKEDDEKISLTGDELNNILNTADFTEETGTDVAIGLADDDTGDSDMLTGIGTETDSESKSKDFAEEPPEGQGISEPPEGQDISVKEDLTGLPSDQSTTETGLSEDIVLSDDIELSDDIGLSEEAVPSFSAEENEGEPATHDLTTEDTNYLDKDAVVEEEESINLEEAVIDEPDLSSEIEDNPIEEPLPDDLSVNLEIEEFGSQELGNLGITAEESATGESGVEEPVSLDIAPQEPGAEEPVSLDIAPEEPGAEEPVSLDIAPEEPGAEEPVSLDIAPEEPGAEEPVSLDIAPEEPGAEEPVSLDIAPQEPGAEEPVSLDIATEEPGAEEPVSLDITPEEPGNLEVTAEEPAAEELSILELGAEDFEIAEPVLEETASGQTEEVPVSEEDLGIPAEDEHEEDFGILVVDDEPPAGILKEAEEVHEETAAKEAVSTADEDISGIPKQLKQELKTVLSYMDQLLEALPDEKIEEFARSEYYDTYKKLFRELGIV